MVGAGLVTTVPLLMFASAAQRIPLSTVGILQYITPTLQFLLGVFLYHEPFNLSLLIGFSIVWLALIIFWGKAIWRAASRAACRLPPDDSYENSHLIPKSGDFGVRNYGKVIISPWLAPRLQTSEFLENSEVFFGDWF